MYARVRSRSAIIVHFETGAKGDYHVKFIISHKRSEWDEKSYELKIFLRTSFEPDFTPNNYIEVIILRSEWDKSICWYVIVR